MAKIKIKNLRNCKPSKPYDFIVDRRSPLGNPFFMKDETCRELVLVRYDDWFWYEPHPKVFYTELGKLKKALKKYGKLRLFCWCHPLPCHARTIKRSL